MHVEWRDGGGCAHLVGVTEARRMLENYPNSALSVLFGLGRCEAGRTGVGMEHSIEGG